MVGKILHTRYKTHKILSNIVIRKIHALETIQSMSFKKDCVFFFINGTKFRSYWIWLI